MGVKVEPTRSYSNEENGILKATEEFADSTAIHAIPHIFKTTNRLFKYLWALITLVSFGRYLRFLCRLKSKVFFIHNKFFL